jgi:hypothetical protein
MQMILRRLQLWAKLVYKSIKRVVYTIGIIEVNLGRRRVSKLVYKELNLLRLTIHLTQSGILELKTLFLQLKKQLHSLGQSNKSESSNQLTQV